MSSQLIEPMEEVPVSSSITPHSFIPGLKPSFSANPSHHSLLLPQDWLHRFSGLFTDTSEHICFYFLVFLFFALFTFWFCAVD